MNPIVHFEIMAGPDRDKKALQRFYADTFGWKVDAANPMEYGMVDTGGRGINGAVDAAQDHAKGVIYVEVDDPAVYLKKIVAAGGAVIQDVTVVPNMVTFATFRDPAGNEMGLVQPEPPA